MKPVNSLGRTVLSASNSFATVILYVCMACAANLILPPASFAQAESPSDSGSVKNGSDDQETEAEKPLSKRWIPSVAIIMGATIQEWNGSHSSQIIPGGSGAAQPIRKSDANNDFDVTPSIALSIELMTPELPIPMPKPFTGGPRAFVGAEWISLFGFTRTLARERNPGTIASPLRAGESLNFKADFFLGQGAETRAEIREAGFGAYAGLSFPLEVLGRNIRVKPNVAWMRYRVGFDGRVVDAECTTANDCQNSAFVRELNLSAGTSETYHGIGPGLDLELEATTFGDIGTTIFVGFRSYRLLGDTKTSFSTTRVVSDAFRSDDIATANFKAEVDEWMHRFLVGFRLEWHGPWWPR